MSAQLVRDYSVVAIVLIISILVGVVYYFFFTDDDTLCKNDPAVCPCLKIIPDYRVFGISLELDSNGKLNKVTFGGDNNREEDPSTELVDSYVMCLLQVRDDIELINYARLQVSPIGQIADLWNSETGFKLILRPSRSDDELAINNLQIGPASGLKWDIVNEWCNSPEIENCVSCSSTRADQNEVAVEVRLKNADKLVREYWSDNWPIVPKKDRKPWEDIDDKGMRFLYRCGV